MPDGGDWAGRAHGEAVAAGVAGDTAVDAGADDVVGLAGGGGLAVAVAVAVAVGVAVTGEVLDAPPPHAVSINTVTAQAARSERCIRPV